VDWTSIRRTIVVRNDKPASGTNTIDAKEREICRGLAELPVVVWDVLWD
jgi:hypothetical protein